MIIWVSYKGSQGQIGSFNQERDDKFIVRQGKEIRGFDFLIKSGYNMKNLRKNHF